MVPNKLQNILRSVPRALRPALRLPAEPLVAQQSQGVLPSTQIQTPHSNRTSLSSPPSNARGDAITTLADLKAKIARMEENLRVEKRRKLDWERREKKETLKKRHSEVAAEMARLESELRELDSDEGRENQTEREA